MTKNKKVTSYDVAREAGVSQSAVSRVFRPGLSVSAKTREKVTAVANKMGYRPNAIARMLITKQSGMVAVIVSSRANENYPEVLSQVSKQLAARNKRVLLFTLDDAEGVDASTFTDFQISDVSTSNDRVFFRAQFAATTQSNGITVNMSYNLTYEYIRQ